MLYPTDITIKKKQKLQVIKESSKNLRDEVIGKIKYLILERTNLWEKIAVKLHI
jgi:hypothetical protein